MGNPAESTQTTTSNGGETVGMKGHPMHISTVAPELYFHVKDPTHDTFYRQGTVFFRQDPGQPWMASVAIKNPGDQFNRRFGRSKSRREFFVRRQQKRNGKALINVGYKQPEYDDAVLVMKHWIERFHPHIVASQSTDRRFSANRMSA